MTDPLYVLMCEDFFIHQSDCPKIVPLLITDTSLLSDQLDPIERYFIAHYACIIPGSLSIILNDEMKGSLIFSFMKVNGTPASKVIGDVWLQPTPTKFFYQ